MPENPREPLHFDVERYVRLSKKVDISDLDLSQAARYPISDEEIRALTYMTDIESHHRLPARHPQYLRHRRPADHRFSELLGL